MNRTELQIAVSDRSIPLSDLLCNVDALSTADRVALLNYLCEQQSVQQEFSQVWGNQSVEEVLWQINRMSRQQLGEVLKVIAFRLARK